MCDVVFAPGFENGCHGFVVVCPGVPTVVWEEASGNVGWRKPDASPTSDGTEPPGVYGLNVPAGGRDKMADAGLDVKVVAPGDA